jgi:lipoprotein-anchoring transpeptidase ErfK/SrfK
MDMKYLIACVSIFAMGMFIPAASFAEEAQPDIWVLNSKRAYIAPVVAPVALRRAPAGERFDRVQPLTSWGNQPTQLLILRARPIGDKLWLKVRLSERPNTRSGWIDADYTRPFKTPYRVTLTRRNNLVRVYRSGRVIKRFRAVLGAPSTPTPRGLFAIYEKQRQRSANGFLGPWALHLTAHSEVLKNYGGGPGRVAMHGRGGASLNDPLGSDRSHGCIRINNSNVSWAARVLPVGTPFLVR